MNSMDQALRFQQATWFKATNMAVRVYSLLVLAAVLVLSYANGQEDDNVPNLQNLADNFPQFNTSQVPGIEDAERLFREKCQKNTEGDAYLRAIDAPEKARQCVTSLVNATALKEEIELAKPTGDLDVVFSKYCRKSPKLIECLTNFTSAIEPCLEETEKESMAITKNITMKILDFVCYRDGDRIALFIAEGGVDCLNDHRENIQDCINSTISHHVPSEVPSTGSMPLLVLGAEQCRDILRLKTCVVNKLENCREPTPANMAESMMKYVYKASPCASLVPL